DARSEEPPRGPLFPTILVRVRSCHRTSGRKIVTPPFLLESHQVTDGRSMATNGSMLLFRSEPISYMPSAIRSYESPPPSRGLLFEVVEATLFSRATLLGGAPKWARRAFGSSLNRKKTGAGLPKCRTCRGS